MPNITNLELQALNGFVNEMIRLAQAITKNAPSCKDDSERIERQGQAASRVLTKIQERG
jgi:hypothetical protein